MCRYRADNVGSLLRPAKLLAARDSGASADVLRELEDRAIACVLGLQRELGFDVFTDGELRRGTFMSDFTESVAGFDQADGVARTWQGADVAPTPIRGIVTGRIRALRRLTAHELPFLQKQSPGPIKMTLPSPTQFPAIAYKKGVSQAAYATHSAFLHDVTQIIADEARYLAAEEVDYVQFDAPRYSYYLDPAWRDFLRAEFEAEPDELLDEAVDADNVCLRAAKRDGTTLAVHLCRGNNRSRWYAQGSYDAIAERLFSTLEADRFLLEYDDERSGTFAPLRFVPRGKTVVLGLISSKVPQLEDAEELVRRIHDAARYIPLENLAVSTQCGFASTAEGNLLTIDEQRAKLALVGEVARAVWD
jgi:5-methyltetrahydropteroyltriglutamate--homocysteine methyltransferase